MPHMAMKKIDIRVSDELLIALTDWRERQEYPPTQSEAIRRAIKTLVSYSRQVREGAGK